MTLRQGHGADPVNLSPSARGPGRKSANSRARALATALHIARTMFYRVTVLGLMGCLILLVLDGQMHDAQRAARLRRAVFLSARASAGARSLGPAGPVARDTRIVDVRRADVERLLSEPQTPQHPRLVPTFARGRPAGLKVFALGSGALLRVLGLENGDVLRAINDHPVLSETADPLGWWWTAALGARVMPELAATGPGLLDMDVLRRGRPLRILTVVHP